MRRHAISSREDYDMYEQVPNPEDYPKRAFNEECEKCIHGQVVFFRGDYEFRYQSTLCTASNMLVCQRGFIKPKEFRL